MSLSPFDLASIVVVLAAILGYINHVFIKIPHVIGLTLLGAILSLFIVLSNFLWPFLHLTEHVRLFLDKIDFHSALMQGMLSFLLFAGALHVNLGDLLKRKWAVCLMSTLGVLLSTMLIGLGFKLLTLLFALDVPLIWCLVFGALISPTDPVAVMGILKLVRVPPALKAKISGESLFNDGIGVVLFSILLTTASGAAPFSMGHAAEIFLHEAVGGGLLGFVLGALSFYALKSIDEYNLEVLLTLALVMGGYTVAQWLHVSGPVAMAVAGLWIGNHGKKFAMSPVTRMHLSNFWNLTDEILNSVLFVLIGLELIAITLYPMYFLLGVLAILLVLAARSAAVFLPLYILSKVGRAFSKGAFPLLVWGGLRGGISIALALSLPETPFKNLILTVTYVIVVFSVVVQGSTIGRVVKRFVR